MTTEHPIWPWAEANQGLFSLLSSAVAVVALLFALCSLWREVTHERRIRQRRIQELRDAVCAAADDLLSVGRRELDKSRENSTRPNGSDFYRKRRVILAAITDLRQAVPMGIYLSLAISDLKFELDPTNHGNADSAQAEGAQTFLENQLKRLQASRDAVARA